MRGAVRVLLTSAFVHDSLDLVFMTQVEAYRALDLPRFSIG